MAGRPHPELQKSQKLKGFLTKIAQNPVGIDEIDKSYLTPCAHFYYAYHECIKDTLGDFASCKAFRKSVKRCEEKIGLYEQIFTKLKIKNNGNDQHKRFSNLYNK